MMTDFKRLNFIIIIIIIIITYHCLTCNQLPVTCNLQPATCNLQPATCNLQPANYTLRAGSAVFHIRYQVFSVVGPCFSDFGVPFERRALKRASISCSFSQSKNSTLNEQRSGYLLFFSVHDFKQFLVANRW